MGSRAVLSVPLIHSGENGGKCRHPDTFVVWKLDRVGRSLTHLIELLKGLKERGIEFISLTEQIDTTTPGGKLIFHLMGALAEFERDLIRERTNAGLAAARARGRVGGRPRKLKTNGKVALAQRMFADQSHSISEICAALGISRATLYRYVKEATSSVSDSCVERGGDLFPTPTSDNYTEITSLS